MAGQKRQRVRARRGPMTASARLRARCPSHPRLSADAVKTWMPGSSPRMTATQSVLSFDLPAPRTKAEAEEERRRRVIGIRPVIGGPPVIIGLIGGTIGVTAVAPIMPARTEIGRCRGGSWDRARGL